MKNIGCKIVKNFKRPPCELVEMFRDVPVANIDDCMNRTAAVRSCIKPLNHSPLLGTAFTVKVSEGDNLMFHKAIDMAQHGDVIVIDAGGDVNRAIFGELMISYCKVRGLAGVIVDGAVRDKDELSEMDFPVYCKGSTPNGPYKNGPGEINTIISFAGQMVRPGDIIVGDGDGIIIIKPEEAKYVVSQVKKVIEKEVKIKNKIISECSYVRPWVDERIQAIGCEIVDHE